MVSVNKSVFRYVRYSEQSTKVLEVVLASLDRFNTF